MLAAAAAAKSLQSCLTLCDPRDGSPSGPAVPGILQARTLEWVAISSSNAWKWKVKVKPLSHIWLFGTPWTAAYQAPPSMGFSRQEYWSGLPLVKINLIHRTKDKKTYPNVTIVHVWVLGLSVAFFSSFLCDVCVLSCVWLFGTPWTVVLPGPSVRGIFQTRILEWVAISYSRGSSWPRDWTHISWISCTGSIFFTTELPRKAFLCGPKCNNDLL